MPAENTSATTAATGATPHTATLDNTICAKRFHRHYSGQPQYSGQPALLDHRGITTVVQTGLRNVGGVASGEDPQR